MAGPDFPLTINRRRLLASAVALPAASIVPGVRPVDAAAAALIQSPTMAPEAEAANVCSVTATRLAEIEARNRLRKEAGLPLLAVSKINVIFFRCPLP